MAYTLFMRILAILFLTGLFTACGTTQSSRTVQWSPKPTGTDIFLVRMNAPVSLSDHPHLSTEIQCGAGWERVALESPENAPGTVDALLAELEESPRAVKKVKGRLLSRTVPWGRGHHSRVIRVLEVNPQESNEGVHTDP